MKILHIKNAIRYFNAEYKSACYIASRNYYNFACVDKLYTQLHNVYEYACDGLGNSKDDIIASRYMVRKMNVFFNCYVLKHDVFYESEVEYVSF